MPKAQRNQGLSSAKLKQVQKQILIKFYLQNLNQALTSKSEPNISSTRDKLIVSRNYRMPIYRTFQIFEKISYRTSNIEYLRYWKIVIHFVFFRRIFSENSENLPKIPKICWKFWKFAENSSKRRSFLRPKYCIDIVLYREKKPNIVSNEMKMNRSRVISTKLKTQNIDQCFRISAKI